MSARLNAEMRDKLGSRWARRLRLQGRIPASIQGEGKDNLNIALDEEQFLTARRHHEHLFDIELGAGSTETTMVRELQWDQMGERIAHVEFRRVIRGQETEAEVELEFTGHPKGGILNHLMTHVTVRADPTNIPDSIEVFVDHLEVGLHLTVGDLTFPEGVRAGMPPETPVATVVVPRGEIEEEVEPVEGVPVEAGEAQTPEKAEGGESES